MSEYTGASLPVCVGQGVRNGQTDVEYGYSGEGMPESIQDMRPNGDDDDEEEEDEDIDNLIEELESQDGDNADYEEEEVQQSGGARLIPEELLQTNTRTGLTSGEVFLRRKQFGYNQMKGTC